MSDLGLSKNWWGAILGVSMIRILGVSQNQWYHFGIPRIRTIVTIDFGVYIGVPVYWETYHLGE